jgi:hypothetical protein
MRSNLELCQPIYLTRVARVTMANVVSSLLALLTDISFNDFAWCVIVDYNCSGALLML